MEITEKMKKDLKLGSYTRVGTASPVLLSEAGSYYDVDPAEPYRIKIEDNNIITIEFGYTKNHAGFKFLKNRPKNTTEVVGREFEFKHERRNGRKFWTKKEGIIFSLLFPADKITLLPIKGYSNVAVAINGESFWLNESGGTHDGGWRDSFSKLTQAFLNIPVRRMNRIMEHSLPIGSLYTPPPLD